MEWSKVDTKVWNDEWFSELDKDDKLLWLYLLTNPFITWSKVYECPILMMSAQTGIDKLMIKKTIQRFIDDKKMLFENGYVVVINSMRYSTFNQVTLKTCRNEIESLPERIFNLSEVQDKYCHITGTIKPVIEKLPETKPTKQPKPVKEATADIELSEKGKSILAIASKHVADSLESLDGIKSNKKMSLTNKQIESLLTKYGYDLLIFRMRKWYKQKLYSNTRKYKDDNLGIQADWIDKCVAEEYTKNGKSELTESGLTKEQAEAYNLELRRKAGLIK